MGFAVQVRYPMVKVTLYSRTARQQWNGINRNPHEFFSHQCRPSGWKVLAMALYCNDVSLSVFIRVPKGVHLDSVELIIRNFVTILAKQPIDLAVIAITHVAVQ
jgi:hypothetical protein